MLEPWVAWCVLLPGCFSQFICTQMWDSLPPHSPPWSSSCCLLQVLTARLPLSAPPTSLHQCFFFNSLVVGLNIQFFCQFWLFFAFKFVLLVVRGGTVCLPTPPCWPEVSLEGAGFRHTEFVAQLKKSDFSVLSLKTYFPLF
uniref:Secreted protein n=1 Tax=Desmodus rotundus TaxID=9430 RepID=K9IWG3_DESRO